MKRLSPILFLLLLLGATAPAFARFQPPEPCKNSFSQEQEIAEGRKAMAQVYKTMPVLPDASPVSQYVQQLGARLVKFAPGYKWPFQFHVVNASDINAFALPGGPVFINLGTIQAANTEAQLAGVMAHEISHVVLRHSTCNITKQRGRAVWWGLAQLGAGILAPGYAGALAQQGIGAIAGLTYLKMSREDEKQADLLGVDILYDAGYDPRGLPQFFETIQAKYGNGGSQFLSDHPNPGNRTEYVDQEIASLPPRTTYVKTSAQFKRISKLVSPMHGYSAKDIASGVWKKQSPGQPQAQQQLQPIDFKPSGAWKSLSDTAFSVSYPDNWRIFDGPGNGVTIAPQDGLVNGNVAYGAIVDLYQPKQGADLASATDQLVATLEQQNQGMKPAGSVEDVLINQVAGKSVELENPTGSPVNGSAEHDWLVTVKRPDGSLSYLVFVAPSRDFPALRPTYEQMLRTFRLK
ncbi:MAG: M48 family metalloprotease [Acidobacteria bacterium]|nr:M48 family metalloprotease [Acidobacteriota bacterium]MBW4044416.1 M48 family metalloprotease [Acidobacteriota bacterium]